MAKPWQWLAVVRRAQRGAYGKRDLKMEPQRGDTIGSKVRAAEILLSNGNDLATPPWNLLTNA